MVTSITDFLSLFSIFEDDIYLQILCFEYILQRQEIFHNLAVMHNFTFVHFSLSHTHVMVEKVLFWGQISEVEILMDLHIMRSTESEIHIFSGCSVRMYVCSITQK